MSLKEEEKIRNIFSEVLGLPTADITDLLAYNSCVEWDSLRHLQLVAMLEDTFNIEIEMDDIIAMQNYGTVKEILQKYLV